MNLVYTDKVNFIKKKINEYKSKGLQIFTSSSFQSHSIPLLDILNKVDPGIPIYFLNTGFHFPETLEYKDEIASLLNLNVIELESSQPKISQKDANGRFLFSSNPSYCCYINKILPLEPILIEKDVWIAGVRKTQNSNRASFNFEEEGKFNTLRFHPILDWSDRLIWKYIKDHKLPKHPLHDKGYVSIGCEPCTQKFENVDAEVRDGRWAGMKKTECGLHLDLIKK